MPTTKSNQFLFLFGFLIILASSGGSGGEADNARAAFIDVAGSDEVSVRRPVGNPCEASDYSVSFDSGVSLGNAAASVTQTSITGPFEVSLPEGVYKVTLSTWLGEQDLPQETNEQWFFTTDSGYSSPTSIDSSPHLLMNQAFDRQEISATTSIELQHGGSDLDDIANVVHPLCIGFDSISPLVAEDAIADKETESKPGVSVLAAGGLLP